MNTLPPEVCWDWCCASMQALGILLRVGLMTHTEDAPLLQTLQMLHSAQPAWTADEVLRPAEVTSPQVSE
jgi:hypothetical protein